MIRIWVMNEETRVFYPTNRIFSSVESAKEYFINYCKGNSTVIQEAEDADECLEDYIIWLWENCVNYEELVFIA